MNPLFFLGLGIVGLGLVAEKRKNSVDIKPETGLNGDSKPEPGTQIAKGAEGENEKPDKNNSDNCGD